MKREYEDNHLTEDTKHSLVIRLDPCAREAKRTTVMSIAYLPGIDGCGMVWCGMGSGAIMIYETDSWTCLSELR